MYKISILPEEIESLPLGTFPGEIKVISAPGLEYDKAIFYLARQKVLGFDTETRPVFSPGHRQHGVALLQLSGPDKAYLFRVQSLGMRTLLCRILSSKRILKVGAAVLDDVRGLQRYAAFEARGFVDLQKIAWEWGIRDKSVKKLSANIMGCRISKAQQLSNWEADALSPSQQLYAATDAWICREMYLKLLASDKHPLSLEERNPVVAQPKSETPAPETPAKKKPRRRHHRGGRCKKSGHDQIVPQEG
ncbi:MAG: 3'-5' exonuclease domain-containing protein 2 [Bacteroidales bacterium]|nr:3'-5' exonuclease domain-containing protein 2 [Bacteroidales bacterium]